MKVFIIVELNEGPDTVDVIESAWDYEDHADKHYAFLYKRKMADPMAWKGVSWMMVRVEKNKEQGRF